MTDVAQSGPEPLVQVEGLTVRVAGRDGPPILDAVSFSVAPGEMTALVGESGAGKSMTTKAILGILDERLFTVSGRIVVAGRDVSAMRARARRRYTSSVTSLVFQNPTKALNPTMRVGPQIAEALRFSAAGEHLSAARARERAVELMRQVGIAAPEERFHAYPHQMSGGMKQRAVIAIALSVNPKLLFCDEPTSSLDVTTQALIMDLLAELRERLGLGILFITHDLVLAASRADDVLVLHSGRLVESLPVRRVFESAAMPYTRDLIARVPGVAAPAPGPVQAPLPPAPVPAPVPSAAESLTADRSAAAAPEAAPEAAPAAASEAVPAAALEAVPAAGPLELVATPPDPATPSAATAHSLTACHYAPQCAYRQDACTSRVPPLALVEPGHLVRCWFPVGHEPLRGAGPDVAVGAATSTKEA